MSTTGRKKNRTARRTNLSGSAWRRRAVAIALTVALSVASAAVTVMKMVDVTQAAANGGGANDLAGDSLMTANTPLTGGTDYVNRLNGI